MRVVATRRLDEILRALTTDEFTTNTMTKDERKELRQYDVYIVHAKRALYRHQGVQASCC